MESPEIIMAETQTPSPDPAPDAGTQLQDPLQRLQFAAADSYEKLAETATQLADQARGVYQTSQESVRQYPAGYVLGAFALGCFLGALLGRD